jgi:hypothetical protein
MGWSRSVNNPWRTYWRLGLGERRLAAQAALALTFARLTHRTLGFKRCHSILGGLAAVFRRAHRGDAALVGDGLVPIRPEDMADRTAALVAAVVRRHPLRANCLQRSLALWCVLKGQGIEADLRVGVQNESGQFEAHAWVEYLGRVLNDGADVHYRYVAFDRGLIPGRAVAS